MKTKINTKQSCIFLIGMALVTALASCTKLIEASPPKNELTADEAFRDSSTALAALLHIYSKFGLSGGTIEGYFCNYASLYADELIPLDAGSDNTQYYSSVIRPDNSTNAAVWQSIYSTVYECNAFLEGMQQAGISPAVKTQYEGEARFLRALAYFLLVNCYGDVPLVLTTNVAANAVMERSATATVYGQIIEDLQTAGNDLQEAYPSGEKVRANKWAAEALLAKVYLYREQWAEAGKAADAVISCGLYTPLEAPGQVFLKNSKEAILQFAEKNGYTWDGSYFQPFFGSLSYVLPSSVTDAYMPQDLRRTEWISDLDNGGTVYHYPAKYKNNGFQQLNDGEYTMCLRAAELYLIRAEAVCHQGKVAEAIDDVNVIRMRAGAAPLTVPSTQDACLEAIYAERKKELFTEWGNRFFDLKRSGRIDAVLGSIKAAWKPEAALWPIPQAELSYNAHLLQNPGY